MTPVLILPRCRRGVGAESVMDTEVYLPSPLAARESAADSSVRPEGTLPRGFRLNRFWGMYEDAAHAGNMDGACNCIAFFGLARPKGTTDSPFLAQLRGVIKGARIHVHHLFTQPRRRAAPPGADPALDHAAATTWLPNSIGGLDGPVSARQRQRRSTAHA